MTSPITSLARGYVRSRAQDVMEYQCRIERITKGNHDEDTLVYTPGSKATIYEGVCRIWEVTGASTINLDNAEIYMQSTQLSTPYDAPLARVKDEVIITAAPAWDPDMAGKRFQIESSARAGELRATRRYTVASIQ